MFPVPTIAELSDYSGRPMQSYTGFAQNALLQAAVMFTTVTELTDATSLNSDDYLLARMGICAMADWLYLRQPYAQAIAGPFVSENIGSYSYSKPMQEMARNAQAMEVMSESTGVTMYDMAVRFLALRTRAGGVFSGGVTLFERTTGRKFGEEDGRGGSEAVRFDGAGLFLERGEWGGENRFIIKGPDEFNQIDWVMLDINAESFPMDPGLG
jgi:hypothetical protein